jgi:hypothetical protein
VRIPDRQLRTGTFHTTDRFSQLEHLTPTYNQLSLALARLFSGSKQTRDTSFHLADQQALTSLISFNLGASLGRIGDRIGPLSRLWLVSGTMIQALFTTAASIAIWRSQEPSVANIRNDPAWTNVLSFVCVAFASASLGVQGVMGKKLGTPFGTTSSYFIYLYIRRHRSQAKRGVSSRSNHHLVRTRRRSDVVQSPVGQVARRPACRCRVHICWRLDRSHTRR